MSDHRPAVSARGVLDGDPAALAGLCDLRGPSVIAYCQAVCGDDAAIGAAAEAFAAFRAAAVQAEHPLALNPDALLLDKAREAAAARASDPSGGAPRPGDPVCPDIPRLLARAASGSLEPAERHHLRRHLARCIPCRRAQNAQREAERTYARPPVRTLSPIARQTIIAALRTAAPVATDAAPRSARPPARPSLIPPGPPAAAAEAARAHAAAAIEGARVPARATAQAAENRPETAVDRAAAAAARPADPGAVAMPPPSTDARVPADSPPPPPTPREPLPVPQRHIPFDPHASIEAPTGVIPADRVAAALGYVDDPLAPPVDASAAPARPSTPRRRRPGIRVLAPAGVLAVALILILAIAGVFGAGGTHHPPAPAAQPTPTPSLSGAATLPSAKEAAAHRRRLRAAAKRRAARARARTRAAAAAAAKATGATTKTGTVGSSNSTAATSSPQPEVNLAAPTTLAPPKNGAAPASSAGGFRAD